MLSNYFAIVDNGRPIGLRFVIKFGNLHGITSRFLLQTLKIFAGLLRFLALWVTKQEILECGSCVFGGGLVISPEPRRFVPNIPDLILRIRRNRIVREFVDHRLIGLNRGIICLLFLPGQADIELGTGSISAEGRGSNDRSENFDGAIHRRPNRNSQQLYLLSRKVHFTNAKLGFDRFVEIGATGISLHQPAISVCRFHIISLELEQLRRPISGAWSQGILGILPQKVSISLDCAAHISLFLRVLCLVEKLLRVAADFLFTGSDIFYFFSRPENDRCLSGIGETEPSNYNNKQSHSHETWQGTCLRDPVKLARPKNETPGGLVLRQRWCFFVRPSLK